MTAHSSILERLQSLKGPSEEVDAEIVACLNNAMVKRYPPTDDFGPKSRWQFWSKDGAHFLGNEAKFPVPPYTKSLDFAIALVVKVLPGYWSFALKKAMNALPADDPALLPIYVLIEAFRALSPPLEEKP